MGVWGTGIFSDDTAADVRDEYRECLAEGMDGRAATDKLLAMFSDSQEDQDDEPPFWLSLAAAQYRYGRLEDRVRDRAVRIIDDGTDVARFSRDPKLGRARERVLKKLRGQLVGPQRQPVKIRREIPTECDWAVGEVVGFRRDSGEWTALHVQGIGQSRRDRYPVVCVLDIPLEKVATTDGATPVRRVLPLPREIASRLSDDVKEKMRFGPWPDYFVILGLRKRDLQSDRIRRMAKTIPPKVKIAGTGLFVGSTAAPWPTLSNFLDKYLD
jgi:hypothetical protein